MKAFVAGATGETGRRIVRALVERQIPVRTLVRDRVKGEEILPEGVEIVVGDVGDRRGLEDKIGDCTVLLCATGAKPSLNPLGPFEVDYVGTKNLVDAAKLKGIEQFVLVSSLCVSRLFHPLNLFWLVLYWKRQAEAYLQKSGANYTIVRPGGLKLEDSADNIVLEKADTLFEGSLSRTKVAKVCVDALFEAKARNQILEIVARPDAPEQSLGELLEAIA
ncbi:NAD(P)H-binding protein [Synechococcus sp. PCC 7336]|uniref:NAD(P)H-binding protein n=1 Tax=Synechococcus sp. PCC 7336 TaxID=195250 RepID=UPI000347F47F|nr:NAD(P)H-binding protein [Synechococcus sp. PCC 7336]